MQAAEHRHCWALEVWAERQSVDLRILIWMGYEAFSLMAAVEMGAVNLFFCNYLPLPHQLIGACPALWQASLCHLALLVTKVGSVDNEIKALGDAIVP